MIWKSMAAPALIEAEITDFVDDKEPWLGKDFHGVGQPVLFESGTETTCHFQGGEEEEAVSQFCGRNAVPSPPLRGNGGQIKSGTCLRGSVRIPTHSWRNQT